MAALATLKHLAAELAASHEIAKRQTESIIADLVTAITKHLKKGSRLRLVGLGILQVRHRAARMGRNPATPDRNEEWMTLLGIMGRSQYPGSACLRRALSAGFLNPAVSTSAIAASFFSFPVCRLSSV